MKKVLAIFLMVMLLTGAAFAAEAAGVPSAEAACAHASTPNMVIVQEATCTEPGIAAFVCPDCGETVNYGYIPAAGHDYAAVVTEPTCTADGFTTHTCSVCGDSYVDGQTPALGHAYEAVVTPPTCTEPGFTTYTCPACGASYTDAATEPTGHNYVYQYDADVVYDEAGAITGYNSYGTWMCGNCGDVVAASEGNAIYYIGPVTGAAAPAAAAAPAVANPDYDQNSVNWVMIEIVLAIVVIVVGAVLMLSFGKKKPLDEQ